MICREGSLEELITKASRAQTGCRPGRRTIHERLRVRTFNQRVSTSNIVLCAAPLLAKRLVKNFPGSLDGAPAILPVSEMALRR